ncbi:hypothetical protein CTI12_AA254330 [Artemisia annua]|uniref:Uncharacterized protein n=1 Tax=Artemisia annua TaxID=35608 RepID=A0A2U1NLM2_ARTAN|nr:hypothetical protein CTI12_AA254330 [Artemisia annua]
MQMMKFPTPGVSHVGYPVQIAIWNVEGLEDQASIPQTKCAREPRGKSPPRRNNGQIRHRPRSTGHQLGDNLTENAKLLPEELADEEYGRVRMGNRPT